MQLLNVIEEMREAGHSDTHVAVILIFLLSYVLYEDGVSQSKVFDECFELILEAGVLRGHVEDHAK